VLSIATVQRKLAQSITGDVSLRPYLTELCESLAASMIRDPTQLSLVVNADDSYVTANASVSIGLIVTELVINALKHAFPDHRRGVIVIDYRSQGKSWKLSVSDDGVGMPRQRHCRRPGATVAWPHFDDRRRAGGEILARRRGGRGRRACAAQCRLAAPV
jgi:two-component sensor histidine kinase